MDAPTTKSNHADPQLKQRLVGLYGHMAKRLGIKQAPRIRLTHNPLNAKEPFGLTAYYNQNDRSVRLYITERHPTDILRSFAHELIHHWQNEHGALPAQSKRGEHAHYAQKDPVLRQREMEAYLLGNILFRDWQDENRYGPIKENLEIKSPPAVQTAIKKMLFDLVKTHALQSYHRPASSGDMDPMDFLDELARKLELELNRFIEVINNRGNRENQPNMIRETMTRSQLKELIMSRIGEASKKVKGGKNQNYAAWLRSFLAQKDSQKKKGEKYYQIGFSDENHYCWYWDDKDHKLIANRGGSHMKNFGREIPYHYFRGRYDMKTKELSMTVPEYGALKITGDPKKDAPPGLIDALEKTFPNHKLFYFPFFV